MLLLTCNNCGASVTTNDGSDPDAQLNCRPDRGCCLQDHHHGQAANACPAAADPGYHDGQPCHHGDEGRVCVVRTPQGEPCPGGHCGLGVAGCTVCRPITITVLGVTVSPAGGN